MAYDEEAQLRARHFPLDRAIRRPGTPAARPFCLYVSHHHPHDPFHVRFAQVRDALRALVHDRFDVARIEAGSWASVAKRVVVRDAMRANDTHRDYEPRFDPTIRFVC